jgi:hypothetical protein
LGSVKLAEIVLVPVDRGAGKLRGRRADAKLGLRGRGEGDGKYNSSKK